MLRCSDIMEVAVPEVRSHVPFGVFLVCSNIFVCVGFNATVLNC